MTDKPKEVPGWAEKHNFEPARNEEATQAMREMLENPNAQGTVYNPGRNPTLPEGEAPPGMEQIYDPNN